MKITLIHSNGVQSYWEVPDSEARGAHILTFNGAYFAFSWKEAPNSVFTECPPPLELDTEAVK